mgnify:CR=1 FL=1
MKKRLASPASHVLPAAFDVVSTALNVASTAFDFASLTFDVAVSAFDFGAVKVRVRRGRACACVGSMWRFLTSKE